ncbi:unnamed protein product [Urochloa humidicola]
MCERTGADAEKREMPDLEELLTVVVEHLAGEELASARAPPPSPPPHVAARRPAPPRRPLHLRPSPAPNGSARPDTRRRSSCAGRPSSPARGKAGRCSRSCELAACGIRQRRRAFSLPARLLFLPLGSSVALLLRTGGGWCGGRRAVEWPRRRGIEAVPVAVAPSSRPTPSSPSPWPILARRPAAAGGLEAGGGLLSRREHKRPLCFLLPRRRPSSSSTTTPAALPCSSPARAAAPRAAPPCSSPFPFSGATARRLGRCATLAG